MIHLNDVIAYIDSLNENGEPRKFSCKVITADLNRDTGGEILTLHDVRLNKNTIQAKKIKEQKEQDEEALTILPNEFKNATRNVALPNGEIRKIHVHLLISFNNQEVII